MIRKAGFGAWILLATVVGQAQGAAKTPPMGWNSWNHFGAKVTEADVRRAADLIVSTGMKDAGYLYINVDDGWQGTRDAQGVLHPNNNFPDMKALGDYIHSKGLKFGIYSSPGATTCGNFPASLGHEEQDAKMYASWGVDYLKYDLCSFDSEMLKARDVNPSHAASVSKALMIDAYRKMGNALHATGRPILYSLCQYGWDDVWEWGPKVGAQLWRTTDDISDSYGRMMIIALSQRGLSRYAGPDHWNDPDMLEVGNGKMTSVEYRTHMSLWAILAAPLLAGNDLSKMSADDRNILMNREVIAIDQDADGKQGDLVLQDGDISVWTRQLSGGRLAICIVSTSAAKRFADVDLAQLHLQKGAHLRDVWAHQDLGAKQGVFNTRLAGHGAVLLVATP